MKQSLLQPKYGPMPDPVRIPMPIEGRPIPVFKEDAQRLKKYVKDEKQRFELYARILATGEITERFRLKGLREQVIEYIDATLLKMCSNRMAPELIYAYWKTAGLFVTIDNRHLLAEEDVEKWDTAITSYHTMIRNGLEPWQVQYA